MIGLTGATGFVGMTHLAHCVRHGLEAKILVRPSHPFAKSPPDGVHVAVGDLGDLRALSHFAEGLTVCFHYAARASFKGAWSKFEATNVFGTENLVSACHDVERLIFCSTQAVVLEDRDIREADESLAYPTEFIDPYARSKSAAEQIVINQHPGGTVVRPPWVWGAGDTNNLPTLIKPTLEGRMGYFNGGVNLLETVHVVNLVHAMNCAARCDISRGKIYFATDDEPVKSKAFSNALLEACGLSSVSRSYPSGVVRAMLWADNLVGGGRVGINRSSFIYMTREQTFSDAAIRGELGYRCPISRTEGLQEMATWCERIDGVASVCPGRRRGESRQLVERTWDHLLSEGALVGQLAPD